MAPKRKAAAENTAEKSGSNEDAPKADEGASPAKKGRGRPKGSYKGNAPVAVKKNTGRGRGRPPLSAEEKAKRQAERAAGKSTSKTGKPLGRPRKVIVD
nr:hypothetical protein BaRGS_004911 [Batillaria attramentaria]